MAYLAAEGEKKKVGKPIGDPVMGRDAPITEVHLNKIFRKKEADIGHQ